MNCINLKIRTKNKTKYLYCKLLNKKIIFNDCKDCKNFKSKYKKLDKPLKKSHKTQYKHKITKFTNITQKVKKEVWERDNHKCIYCGIIVPISCANSHYIKRSQLGLGIPQNIVTACPNCHNKYDFGINILEMKNYTKNYLKSKYIGWSEKDLKYKKI